MITTYQHRGTLFGAVVATLLLSACGGGGGGGDGDNNPLINASEAEITAENSKQVATETMTGVVSDTGLAEDILFDVLEQDGEAASLRWLDLAVTAGQDLLSNKRVAASDTVAPTAVETITEACGDSGSMTIRVNDADNSRSVSVNDSVSLGYNRCSFLGIGVFDGSISFTFTEFSGDIENDIPPYTLGAQISFNSLSLAVEGSATGLLNGAINSRISETATEYEVSSTIDRYTFTIDAVRRQITDGSQQYTISKATGAYRSSYQATYFSDLIGGEVEYETTVPFEGSAQSKPSSGEMVVKGANGAVLTIIAIDSTTVRLELDSDGDGTVERSEDLAWDALVDETLADFLI